MKQVYVNCFYFALLLCVPVLIAWAQPLALDLGEWPAGTGTVDDRSPRAFGLPLNGATREEVRRFSVGNSFFRDNWVTAPSSTPARDGLGPIYNAVSCGACHNQDGRGIAYRETTSGGTKLDVSVLFRLSKWNPDGQLVSHPLYGGQLNPFGVISVPGEGIVKVRFAVRQGHYPDGSPFELQEPLFDFSDLTYGPLTEHDAFSARVAPQMIGLGLIENIPAEKILALEDLQDHDGDGISGRANWVQNVETKELELGRFGWKASQPTVRQQVAAAFLGDMGLTTPLFVDENCLPHQTECLASPNGGEPEVSASVLDQVVVYSSLLSVPKRRAAGDDEIIKGQALFHKVQCASCHQPHFTTGSNGFAEVLNGQTIWPYSDFLLHDMGEELADHRPDELASGREWRTPPLWGIGLFQVVSGHNHLLHDGRARGVEEAVLWHGGEAEASKRAFMNLSALERQAVVRFVNDL